MSPTSSNETSLFVEIPTVNLTSSSLDSSSSVDLPVTPSSTSTLSTTTPNPTEAIVITSSTTVTTPTTTYSTTPSTPSTTTEEVTTMSSTTSTTTTTTTTQEPSTVSSTTPTTTTTTEKIIYNKPPMLEKRLQKIPAIAGKPLSYIIPYNTFRDEEDGDTRNLHLSLKLQGAPLKSTNWLQFNSKTQEVYGL